LRELGCTIESRNKLPNVGWYFVFTLGWKSKPSSANSMWSILLKKAAQEKLIDLNQDRADLEKMTEAWLPLQPTETSKPQGVIVTRAVEDDQTKELVDGGGW